MNVFASFGHPEPPNVRLAHGKYTLGLGLLGESKTAEAHQAFKEAVRLNPTFNVIKE